MPFFMIFDALMQFICNICVTIGYEEIATPRKVSFLRLYIRLNFIGDRNAPIKIFNESVANYFGLQLVFGGRIKR